MFNTEQNLSLISYFMKIILIIAIIYEFIKSNYSALFISILTLILLLFPYFLKNKYNMILPLEIEFLITFFIFGTLFLGEVQGFYLKYAYWDLILHGLSGILLGLLGFAIVYSVVKYDERKNNLTPVFIALFTFTFAVAIGAIWEIYEFTMDTLFGFNMQKTGLIDTMSDLIVDSIGALFISFSAYYYSKNVKRGLFYFLVHKIVKKHKLSNKF